MEGSKKSVQSIFPSESLTQFCGEPVQYVIAFAKVTSICGRGKPLQCSSTKKAITEITW